MSAQWLATEAANDLDEISESLTLFGRLLPGEGSLAGYSQELAVDFLRGHPDIRRRIELLRDELDSNHLIAIRHRRSWRRMPVAPLQYADLRYTSSDERWHEAVRLYHSSDIPSLNNRILNTRTGELRDFLLAEEALFRVSGVFDVLVSFYTQYILKNIKTLIAPPDFRKLYHQLDQLGCWLAGADTRQVTCQAGSLTLIFGGILMIAMNIDAIPLIKAEYVPVSMALGGAIIQFEAGKMNTV